MAKMTSRERVLRTVNFQPADRVPIDLGGMKASSISVKAYNQVKAQLGMQTPTRIWDPKFMIASVEEAVMQRFHLDVVPLDVSSALHDVRPDSEWLPKTLYEGAEGLLPPGTAIGTDAEGRWVLLDEHRNPTSFRMPRDGYYFDDVAFNAPGATIDPAAFRPVTGFTDEQLRAVEAQGQASLRQHRICPAGLGRRRLLPGLEPDHRPPEQRHHGAALRVDDHADDREGNLPRDDGPLRGGLDQCLKQLHEAVGDRCFAWGIAADDSGTQRGEFIRPELWAEMIKPHYAKLCAWIHRNTQWKTFLHSCGSIYHLIPHMIEAGVDILNPVQTSAANMEPERLKAEFGGKIVFWGGGCDTQRVLPTATPEEIREHVRERLAIFKPGGGYVFNQVHNIQPNVPAGEHHRHAGCSV